MKKLLFVFSILLAFSVGVYASSPTQQLIQAYLSPGVTVVIDDKTQTFTDANGSVVYPITYNGTTYLPLRAIGKVMGKEVTWDGTTKTVYLGTVPDTSLLNTYMDIMEDVGDLATSLFTNAKIIYDKNAAVADKQIAADKFMDAYDGLEDQWTKVKSLNTSDYSIEPKQVHDSVYDYVNEAVITAEAYRLYTDDLLKGKYNEEALQNMSKYSNSMVEKGKIALKSLDLLQ